MRTRAECRGASVVAGTASPSDNVESTILADDDITRGASSAGRMWNPVLLKPCALLGTKKVAPGKPDAWFRRQDVARGSGLRLIIDSGRITRKQELDQH